MEKGDISNHSAARALIVFEGAVAFCTDNKEFAKLAKKDKWSQAIKLWTLNEFCVRRILYLFHRKDITFEVVTFLGQAFANEARVFLDEQDIPIHRVWSTTPESLGRSIAYMPDLAWVYDPDPEHFLMYGSKGGHLADVGQIGHFINDRGMSTDG